MRKGAQSFVGFSAFTVPAIVVFVLITGIASGGIALLGLFFVLQFANNLDRRSN